MHLNNLSESRKIKKLMTAQYDELLVSIASKHNGIEDLLEVSIQTSVFDYFSDIVWVL